jgi:hypothetical protein
MEAARAALLGHSGGGPAVSAALYLPDDPEGAEVLLGEVGPLASLSGGALLPLLPGRADEEGAAASLDTVQSFDSGASPAERVELTAAGIDVALIQASVQRPDAAGLGEGEGSGGAEGGLWVVGLPASSVGKGPLQITARRCGALPLTLGLPLYLAALGEPPRAITALIDGSEAAELGGVVAANAALTCGARLTLVVVTFEGDREPHEQADFVLNYARTAGLSAVEASHIAEPGPHAVERAVRAGAQLVVAPAAGRALKTASLVEMAVRRQASVLLV